MPLREGRWRALGKWPALRLGRGGRLGDRPGPAFPCPGPQGGPPRGFNIPFSSLPCGRLRQRCSTLAPDQKSESLPNYALYAVPPENLLIAGCADHQRCDSDAARIAKHAQIAARLVAIARLGLRLCGCVAQIEHEPRVIGTLGALRSEARPRPSLPTASPPQLPTSGRHPHLGPREADDLLHIARRPAGAGDGPGPVRRGRLCRLRRGTHSGD